MGLSKIIVILTDYEITGIIMNYRPTAYRLARREAGELASPASLRITLPLGLLIIIIIRIVIVFHHRLLCRRTLTIRGALRPGWDGMDG